MINNIEVNTQNSIRVRSRVGAIYIDPLEIPDEKHDADFILITHDLGLVANFCDSVAIMYAGKIVEKGLLEDIFDRNRKHHPYTVGLFNSIPDLEGGQERLKSIPGLMPNPSELPQGCSFNPRCASCMDKCMSRNVPVYREGSHEIVCHLMGENRND